MSRVLPRPNAETQPFWIGCAQGRLLYQACARCGQVQVIPRSLCSACQCSELEWKQSAGTGTVLTHTTVHRAPTLAFKEMVPYVIAIVDMDEGFRLMVNVRPEIQKDVDIGRRIRLGVTEVEGMNLPHAEEIL